MYGQTVIPRGGLSVDVSTMRWSAYFNQRWSANGCFHHAVVCQWMFPPCGGPTISISDGLPVDVSTMRWSAYFISSNLPPDASTMRWSACGGLPTSISDGPAVVCLLQSAVVCRRMFPPRGGLPTSISGGLPADASTTDASTTRWSAYFHQRWSSDGLPTDRLRIRSPTPLASTILPNWSNAQSTRIKLNICKHV